ncbi:MAG: SRPBCC family protein [Acidobacteriaceae bacterium]|nr:SRPBCC family protein [Acidobacteriaceae bacterium]
MGSIRKQIITKASTHETWSALCDVGALHTRLVPGFVVDTKLEADARIVTFGNGLVIRESIVAISDDMRRVVWSATTEQLKHYNGSAEVVTSGDGQTRVVWTADFLPDEAAPWIDSMMEQAITVMRKTLDRLAQ